MATVATISVNFAQYDPLSFTTTGVIDRSINPRTLSQFCLGSASGNLNYMGGFLKKTGDTISDYLILHTSSPTLDLHASSKGYVDSRVTSLSSSVNDTGPNGFVKIGGSTMTGFLTLNANPTSALHAVTKQYVDSVVGSAGVPQSYVDSQVALKVSKAGDTMTGPLILNANPVAALGAATKQYVDSVAGSFSGGVSSGYVDAQDALKVSKSGDSMSGFLTLNANPISPLHAATKQYVDSVAGSSTGGVSSGYVDAQDALKVSKSGDSMSGYLTLVGAPTSALHAATKQYVDSAIASIPPSSSTGGVTQAYVDNADNIIKATVTTAQTTADTAQTTANTAKTTADTALASVNGKYDKTGGTISGAVTISSGGLNVNGAIVASGDITAFSDERLKSNINRIENALDKTLQLNGVTFETKENKKSLGVIAQNVLSVLPEVVQENDNGYLSVAYGNIVGVLIEAIKELNAKVEKLEAKN